MRFLFAVLLALWVSFASAGNPVILVLGDSLSSAYGLSASQGWVNLLQEKLRREAYPHVVVNASVSGDTTSGGLARLPAALDRHKPQIVLIELGGNDGLRGLPVQNLQANLEHLAELSRGAGAQPLLFEMRIPPNYGARYADSFRAAFAAAADRAGAPLVPFFLGALVERPDLYFQDDGIHPGPAAQALMLDAVWPHLLPLLKS